MKTVLLAVVILLVACSAHAQDTAPFALRVAQGAFIGLEVLDVHSTWTALALGAKEGNGVMEPIVEHRLILPAVKAGAVGLVIGGSEYLWRRGHRKTAVVFLVGLASVYGVTVTHNYQVLAARRRR